MNAYTGARAGELQKTARTDPTVCVEIFNRVHWRRLGGRRSTTTADALIGRGINLGCFATATGALSGRGIDLGCSATATDALSGCGIALGCSATTTAALSGCGINLRCPTTATGALTGYNINTGRATSREC